MLWDTQRTLTVAENSKFEKKIVEHLKDRIPFAFKAPLGERQRSKTSIVETLIIIDGSDQSRRTRCNSQKA